MAITYTTSTSTLQKIGRQVHSGIIKGFARRSETWKLWKTLKDFEMNASQRSVTTTIDITPQGVGSFIAEFGTEANPKTAAPSDLTFTWVSYNDRFSFSKTSEYLDRKFRDGQLVRQAVFQTGKMIEGLTKRTGIGFYGTNTGELCQTSTDATSAGPADYALTKGFGQSSITDATYLAQFFAAGDYVALIRSGALVTNAIGLVNSVSNSTGINVTWAGSVNADANDSIVFANQYPIANSLAIGSTEYVAAPGTKSPTGLMDFCTVASVHGLSSASAPLWNVAGSDTTGGDLTGTRIKKAMHQVKNLGGGDVNLLILAQGVARRLYQTTQSAVHFQDPLGMEILGSVKTGSIKQHDMDPLCPPGWAFAMDKSDFYKWTLVDVPDEDTKSLEGADNANIDKVQDANGSVFSFDFPYQNITKKRASLYYWNGLTEA